MSGTNRDSFAALPCSPSALAACRPALHVASNNSTLVAWSRSAALPSSVSRWTSSLLVFVGPHQQVLEHHAAGRLDPQAHAVAVLDAVICGMLRDSCGRAARRGSRPVSVRPRPSGPTSTQPGVPSILPLARTGRSMPSEMPSVKASSTWLSGRVGPSIAHRGQHPPPRADDHHRLFGREKAVLVQRLHRRQLAARAEQHLDVLVGQMDSAGPKC